MSSSPFTFFVIFFHSYFRVTYINLDVSESVAKSSSCWLLVLCLENFSSNHHSFVIFYGLFYEILDELLYEKSLILIPPFSVERK